MVRMTAVSIRSRFAWGMLLALLLGLRSLAPAGFMPSFDHGAVTIVACPDASAAVAPMHHRHPVDHSIAHQLCPYAAGAGLGARARTGHPCRCRPSSSRPPYCSPDFAVGVKPTAYALRPLVHQPSPNLIDLFSSRYFANADYGKYINASFQKGRIARHDYASLVLHTFDRRRGLCELRLYIDGGLAQPRACRATRHDLFSAL